jgi:hypothetical protein
MSQVSAGYSISLFAVFNLVVLVFVAWAFIDAAIRPAAAFLAAGKQTKQIWLAILGGCVFLCMVGAAGLFGIFGFAVAVATIVYFVDVRPAVRGMRPGGPWA